MWAIKGSLLPLPGFPQVRAVLAGGRDHSFASRRSLPTVEVQVGIDGRIRAVQARAHRSGVLVKDGSPTFQLPSEAVIVPGLRDPHVHVRAAAAALASLDCAAAVDIPALLARIEVRARQTPRGGWVRGWGYDEAMLAERRAPSRVELERAGLGHPVVVHHRTGHAAVANGAALLRLGVAWRGTAGVDVDGVDRDENGEPTGLLVNAHRILGRVPRLDSATLTAGALQLGAQWTARGVTAITDATATNGVDAISQLDAWARQGILPQHVHAFISADRVDEAIHAGVPVLQMSPRCMSTTRRRVGDSARGPTTVAAACSLVGAKVSGAAEDIPELVRLARRYGWPVAIHAVEVDELEAALNVLSAVGPPLWGRDRIEHCGLVLPEQRSRLGRLPVAVVSNPSFLVYRGSKYAEELTDTEREWLYPVRSLLRAGVLVGAASDAPVTDSNPLEVARAACTRVVAEGPASGQILGSGERVDARTALALVTTLAGSLEGVDVRLTAGAQADFVVLSGLNEVRGQVGEDDTSLDSVRVLATVIGGRAHMLDACPDVDPNSARTA